jgi:hypothetical protein
VSGELEGSKVVIAIVVAGFAVGMAILVLIVARGL